MMLFTLLCLTNAWQTPGVLEIPAYLDRPRVYFQDLDGDGQLDAWATDRDDHLLLWLAAEGETAFRPLPTPVDGRPPRPHLVDGVWRATFYEDGRLFAGFEDAWRVVQDDTNAAQVRPGMEPVDLGTQRLVPTFAGYRLMEDDCLVAELASMPAVLLGEKRLILRYPVPVSRDLNGDGRRDLAAGPVLFGQQQEIGLWAAMQTDKGWETRWSRMQFPAHLTIGQHQFGDLNGDGFQDLVILARPAQEMSLFDEMQFVIYMGNDLWSWDRQPVQVLKTKQNLWQDGPIEVDRHGVTFFYYKGLFRSRFRMDRFRWHQDGYIEPKPESETWTVDDGDDNLLITDLDLNGDGANDLLLVGENQIFWYPRHQGELPFEKDAAQVLWHPPPERGSFTYAGKDGNVVVDNPPIDVDLSQRIGYLRSGRDLGIVRQPDDRLELWSLVQATSGYWYLVRRTELSGNP